MTSRRDFLVATASLFAAGSTLALKPRQRVSLLGRAKLADIVPSSFADWNSTDVSNLISTADDNGLESRLYGQTVERIYRQSGNGPEIMMLLAWGDTQSNELQLHRPEVCYPAFGFDITLNQVTLIPLSRKLFLPARHLVAVGPDRTENISYWTRLGDYLPVSGSEQRFDRVKTVFQGVINDGLLARFSVLADDRVAAFGLIDGFIRLLIEATTPRNRAALVGTVRAAALKTAI